MSKMCRVKFGICSVHAVTVGVKCYLTKSYIFITYIVTTFGRILLVCYQDN